MEAIEKQVASGSVLRPGETFQFGWSVLMIRNASGGCLSLWELDFSGVPGQLDCSVTRSLLALRRQKAVLESFDIGEQIDFPSLQHTAVKCARFGDSSRRMLSRIKATRNDTGWFFGCCDADHDHEQRENLTGGSLYEAACANPEIIDFLAMPTGSLVLIDKMGRVSKAFAANEKALDILPGSYLDLKQRNLGKK
jgi:hypothetical protein